ncbi:MAG: hypothetical protein LBQ89_08060 [Treponema sp.]|jgi:hypothetical protein|nr:hypothetical protein [Treponema sp.]
MTENITHKELCLATAKRFIDKVALYEYKSFSSLSEQPDVLIFSDKGSTLFEIKISLSDFKTDKYKDCRKKYITPYWAQRLSPMLDIITDWRAKEAAKDILQNPRKTWLKLKRGRVEIELIEREHLGRRRYFVCPEDVIPVDKLPEGWGLYYYKGGKFYLKKESGIFRTDLWTECNLAVHALRRYASGDINGILINTYLYRENFGRKQNGRN